uniref:Uncharacterized protein MANES_08G013700 n=1 Tax=Rhizophora mucronata TaxID=61149 RepID=A0A2P2KJC6_RHIMU
MNSSPIVDIPCLDDPLDATKTFSPFCHKLICTWDPEPMSLRSNLGINVANNLCFFAIALIASRAKIKLSAACVQAVCSRATSNWPPPASACNCSTVICKEFRAATIS